MELIEKQIGENTTMQYSIIWLHGLGADASDFADIDNLVSWPKDIAIHLILPSAPFLPVSLNGGMPMRAWYDIYGLNDFSKEDQTGIEKSEKRIVDLIEKEHAKGIPYSHIFLAGFSQGGAVSLYTGLRFKEPLGGIIALSTYLPLAKTLTDQQLCTLPIFMAHGDYDQIILPDFAKQSFELLENFGCTVDWHLYPMEHHLCEQGLIDLSTWFAIQINRKK